MRSILRGTVGLAVTGLLALAALPSNAAPRAERELLGIRIWRTSSEVLARLGPPTRFEIGDTTTTTRGGGGAGAMMMPGGGMGAMMGRRIAAAGGAGMPSGGPRMTGGLPPMGAAGTTGPPAAMSMMMRGMMSGGPGGGMMGGPPIGMTAPTGVGMGGPRTGAIGGTQTTQTSEGDVTWVYERGSNTVRILFNKDGRVIQIESFGYKNGGVTSRGVGLGDPLNKVLHAYGWTSKITPADNATTIDYSQSAHVVFYLVDQGKGPRVVGITIALMELPGGVRGGVGLPGTGGGVAPFPGGGGGGEGGGVE